MENLERQIKGNKQMLHLAEYHNEPETELKFKDIITELEKLLVCPDCGSKLIEKWSGVKCSECDYWFCF